MSVGTIAKVDRYRQMILTAAHKSREPQHLASAMSIIHILHVLYDKVMDHNRDLFVLSKGHGALALYAVLAARGEIKPEELGTIGKAGSILGGHPDRMKVPGVTASTGSLGTGIGMALGMALAKQLKGELGTVYCLVGDGEMQEGSSLEALHYIRRMELENIVVLIDGNQSHDSIRLRSEDELTLAEIEGELKDEDRSCVYYVETIKGHGIEAMEKDPQAWHRRALTDHEYQQFMMEVADGSDVPATRH